MAALRILKSRGRSATLRIDLIEWMMRRRNLIIRSMISITKLGESFWRIRKWGIITILPMMISWKSTIQWVESKGAQPNLCWWSLLPRGLPYRWASKKMAKVFWKWTQQARAGSEYSTVMDRRAWKSWKLSKPNDYSVLV